MVEALANNIMPVFVYIGTCGIRENRAVYGSNLYVPRRPHTRSQQIAGHGQSLSGS